jgi:hypothetical protein
MCASAYSWCVVQYNTSFAWCLLPCLTTDRHNSDWTEVGSDCQQKLCKLAGHQVCKQADLATQASHAGGASCDL